MDWAQILVIILAAFLALFLLLGIVLTILLIRLTQQIKTVTASAQRTASGVENIVSGIGKFTSPSLLFKMATKQAKKLRKKRSK